MNIFKRSAAIALLAIAANIDPGKTWGASDTWEAASGDWSTALNWSGSAVPAAGDTAFIFNSGIATVSQPNAACDTLFLGTNAGSGSLQMNGGSLSVGSTEYIGLSGTGSFTQSGTSGALTGYMYVGYNAGDIGTYNLGGNAQLSAATELIGVNGTGSFTQSGGTHAVSGTMFIGFAAGSNGSYNLSGGQLSTPGEYPGFSGVGGFTQTGGTNAVSYLYLGDNPGGSGSYDLGGGGRLLATGEYVGNGGGPDGGVGVFTQTGGSNAATTVSVNGGYYLLGGGLLQPAGGSTIQVNNGGLQVNGGVLDCTNAATIVAGSGSLLDFSSGVVNTENTSLYVAANSLLIVAQGFDSATSFPAGYTNLGLTHTSGTTLNVPDGTGFGGWARSRTRSPARGISPPTRAAGSTWRTDWRSRARHKSTWVPER